MAQRRAQVDAGVLAGMARMGATPEQVRQAREQAERAAGTAGSGEDFEVWPENWESWMFFLSVQSQWAYVSNGMEAVRVCLPANRLESEMNMRQVPRRRRVALLDDLRTVERAVLVADRELRRAGA